VGERTASGNRYGEDVLGPKYGERIRRGLACKRCHRREWKGNCYCVSDAHLRVKVRAKEPSRTALLIDPRAERRGDIRKVKYESTSRVSWKGRTINRSPGTSCIREISSETLRDETKKAQGNPRKLYYLREKRNLLAGCEKGCPAGGNGRC